MRRWLVDISRWRPSPAQFDAAASLLPPHERPAIARYRNPLPLPCLYSTWFFDWPSQPEFRNFHCCARHRFACVAASNCSILAFATAAGASQIHCCSGRQYSRAVHLAWHRTELFLGVQVRERGRQEAGARQPSAAVRARAPPPPRPGSPGQHTPHARGEAVPG